MWHAPSVPGFDAELYLRLAGEEMLLEGGGERQRPWDSPLLDPASALVAVGAISAAKARAVIADYSLAESMRSEQGAHYQVMIGSASPARSPKARPLKPRRVVACDRTIEGPSGSLRVRRVKLSEDGTGLAITWRPNRPKRASRPMRHMVMFGAGASWQPQPQLTDDRGTTTASDFSGGGSDEEWEGQLTAEDPLAPDTAWIEVDGTRIELTHERWPCEVSIEPLPDEPPARRYLWRHLTTSDFPGPPEIETSIEALIAAGAVQPDDPVLDAARSVRDAMPHHPGMYAGVPRGVRRLPEPWRSLFSRLGKADGPEGTVALGALTPVFDGFTVALISLDSQPEGFEIEVDVAPGRDGRGPIGSGLEPQQLAWWAADDRANHYLGQIGGWSGGEHHGTGEVNFWPALHPQARRLQIMPTAEQTSAVISFPLPWARDRPATPPRPA